MSVCVCVCVCVSVCVCERMPRRRPRGLGIQGSVLWIATLLLIAALCPTALTAAHTPRPSVPRAPSPGSARPVSPQGVDLAPTAADPALSPEQASPCAITLETEGRQGLPRSDADARPAPTDGDRKDVWAPILRFGDIVRSWVSEQANALLDMFRGRASGVALIERSAKAIIRDMDRNVNNATCIIMACKALLNVSGSSQTDPEGTDRVAKIEIASVGGITRLLAAMRTHAGDAEVQRQALETLGWLAAGVDDNAAIIADDGGVTLAIAALDSCREAADVQCAACDLLSVLAADSAYRAERIILGGGLLGTANALALHARHAAAQRAGTAALR